MNESFLERWRRTFRPLRFAGGVAGILVGDAIANAVDPLAPSGGWGWTGLLIFIACAIVGAIAGTIADRALSSRSRRDR